MLLERFAALTRQARVDTVWMSGYAGVEIKEMTHEVARVNTTLDQSQVETTVSSGTTTVRNTLANEQVAEKRTTLTLRSQTVSSPFEQSGPPE